MLGGVQQVLLVVQQLDEAGADLARISVLIVRLFSLLSRRHSCSVLAHLHSSTALALEEDEDEEKEGVVWLNLGDTPTAQRTPERA